MCLRSSIHFPCYIPNMVNDLPLKGGAGKQIKVEDVDWDKQKKLQNKGSLLTIYVIELHWIRP